MKKAARLITTAALVTAKCGCTEKNGIPTNKSDKIFMERYRNTSE